MFNLHQNLPLFFNLIKQGNAKKVRKMIESGYPVNVRFSSGITPVILAAYYGHLEIIQMLVEAGANVNSFDEELNNALLLAVNFGYWDIVNYLMPFIDR